VLFYYIIQVLLSQQLFLVFLKLFLFIFLSRFNV
jgi:hypothetical protein